MRHHLTSYTSMNEWLHMPGRTVPAFKPVLRDLNDWRPLPTHELARQAAEEAAAKQEAVDYKNYPAAITQPDDLYQTNYDSLTNQIAYRWPNPGSPRKREGCIGGTWRHIKEVLCHGGSRTVFVDGLVSVYDSQKFTDKLQAQLEHRPHVKPLYKQMKGDTSPRTTFSNYPVLPDVPSKSSKVPQPPANYTTQRRGYYANQ